MLLEVPRSQNPTVQKSHPIILFQVLLKYSHNIYISGIGGLIW